MYRDTSVSSAGIAVRMGRKWWAWEAVEQAVISHVGRLCGSGLIQGKIRAHIEEEQRSRTVAVRQQGTWTNWYCASTRKITWTELSKPARIKFLIQSVYDVLPSPSKLHYWGLAETTGCPLYPVGGSLEHILSCCPKALG